MCIRDRHYDGEDALVKGQHYLYPHDYPNHWIAQQYLPAVSYTHLNYCDVCKKPVFDQPAICIIALAVNEQGEAALLRQNYINVERYVCVSGYLKSGESAEECLSLIHI